MGHEASREQVSTLRWEFVLVIENLARMEYITIISIMVTMTVWDFVIGVLFGIVVSCESKPLPSSARNNATTHRFMACPRFLLCRSKLPPAQHSNMLHGGQRSLHRPPPSSSPRIHPRSVQTDAHHPTARVPLLWHDLSRRRHPPFARRQPGISCSPCPLCRR